MANVSDRVKPKNPPAQTAKVEASAALFLAGIEQVFTDPNEKRLLGTIRKLRRAPGTLDSAVKLYESRAADSTFRWGVVYLAARVGAPGTAEWLRRVALEPLDDAEHSEADSCETARDNELLVRIMAIEGLGQVAEIEGVKLATDALTAVMANQPDDALQSAAALQFQQLNPDSAPRLKKLLSSHHKHLVSMELKKSPTEVDQRPRSLGLDPGDSPSPPLRSKKGL